MQVKQLTPDLSVAPQVGTTDMADIAAQGFRSIICNRPDGEGADQPSFAEIEEAATAAGLRSRYVPVIPGKISELDLAQFTAALSDLPKPVLAYCRSGSRSAQLWSLAQQRGEAASRSTAIGKPAASHDIVIVGGGAAGAAVAASLLRRNRDLDIAIIEPAETHYYQPGWTMVGGGIFNAASTAKPMAAVLPSRVNWIKAAVTAFDPDNNTLVADGHAGVRYNHLVVCPGIKLDWGAIEGLSETLGKNGVTSNYRYDLAPYTWELVRAMKSGRALFTQPPMPIKCAGAPQKAMYLSADHWLREGVLNKIDIEFFNAGGVLFGVADYVPALMDYVKRYDAALKFHHNLVAIDGPGKTAFFKKTGSDGSVATVEARFDMIHVTPPQTTPDFVRASPLVDTAGWVDVDQTTLRHKRYANIYGLGDVTNTPNAKTAAAARKQAPVVAENLLFDKGQRPSVYAYDGYGSCPLIVERGKVVLAEFTYGGKIASSFPPWLIDGTKPSRLAWLLKERILPPIYWQAMLKGREWMAKPKAVS
ncbi:TIGR01244 family sulfur transferase [Hyphomicrobium sp.]|uniref:TIGR01244 family sulfur transferase n=1 Tax=Hyphomicrobium sp. TaxID=82 RepID=UPI002D79248B|nr:TIGR01244 family sulfur transferase [Hyphomicrobium sp.]HET6391045.1 TIGR01244 family sulfur transferase [Hyphomicrobium sp.]